MTPSIIDTGPPLTATIEYRVFFGAETRTTTSLATAGVSVGDEGMGDFVSTGGDNLVPGSLISGASLAAEVSNEDGAPRLVIRINNPLGGMDAASLMALGQDALVLTGTADTGASATTFNAGVTAGHEVSHALVAHRHARCRQ